MYQFLIIAYLFPLSFAKLIILSPIYRPAVSLPCFETIPSRDRISLETSISIFCGISIVINPLVLFTDTRIDSSAKICLRSLKLYKPGSRSVFLLLVAIYCLPVKLNQPTQYVHVIDFNPFVLSLPLLSI